MRLVDWTLALCEHSTWARDNLRVGQHSPSGSCPMTATTGLAELEQCLELSGYQVEYQPQRVTMVDIGVI